MLHDGWIKDSGTDDYRRRMLIGTPTTGTVRMEWHNARMGQIIPTNWSQATASIFHSANTITTYRYPVADAQNIIVKTAINEGFEWLFLHEHDVLLPPDTFIRLNEYMRRADVPVVSGLYWTRSRPSEPILYRGRGNSFYEGWDVGDVVWVDGVPTGALLIHCSILRAMWDDAEEYQAFNETTRRVFAVPVDYWTARDNSSYGMATGTTDLYWCKAVLEGGYFAKAGWPEYQEMEFPFAVDTNIFCGHINPDGEQFPYANPWLHVPARPKEQPPQNGDAPPDLGVSIIDSVGLGEQLG